MKKSSKNRDDTVKDVLIYNDFIGAVHFSSDEIDS